MTKPTLNKSVVINAPISKVWDAVTNHVMIRQYFFGSEYYANLEGCWMSYPDSGSSNSHKSKVGFLRFEKESLIEFNYWNSLSGLEDLSSNYTKISYMFSAENAMTTMAIREDNIQPGEPAEHSENNWDFILNGLKTILEYKSQAG